MKLLEEVEVLFSVILSRIADSCRVSELVATISDELSTSEEMHEDNKKKQEQEDPDQILAVTDVRVELTTDNTVVA